MAVSRALEKGIFFPRGYIGGLTLSNDASPNAILDISAGVCDDSTHAFVVSLPAFTKSTAGSWAAGTGANGMGAGLTIAASTWYHVFAILTSTNAADIYFDTSVTAANKPSGTVAFRRIGSFRTDASAHILPFSQLGNEVLFKTPFEDVVGGNSSTTATALTLTVPTGLQVYAQFTGVGTFTSATTTILFYSLDQGTQTTNPSGSAMYQLTSPITGSQQAGQFSIRTNTSGQIAIVASSTGTGAYYVTTFGWIDPRGQYS